MDTFYLGVSEPHWICEGSPLPAGLPVCIPRGRLLRRATLPVANRPIFVDSGGFSQLSRKLPPGQRFADWDLTPHQFVRQVRRLCAEVGQVDHVAPMDWMCEPHMVRRTGLTVAEHQRRTVHSFLELRWLAPELPIRPVLQGDPSQGPDDHLRCAEMYARAGIDVEAEPLVGVGSVCRLEATPQITALFAALHEQFDGRARLHGFGLKIQGLAMVAPALASADSHAWSRWGRAEDRCRHGLPHQSEANCPHYALAWRDKVLAAAAATTPAAWRARVQAYRQGDQEALFAAPPPAAPALPTSAERLATAARAFLPEDAEAPLAAALADFQAHLTERQAEQF
ncbi:deazapurine DNA modification protein DpdA family protein [Actinomadura kijaniata]|uniref:deazapurine DNA modification protein DpdA family protein n=1 Tax=Actinomadura kijaniata TaxID=46161 RepID=UPI0008369AF6|nr:hypothetical protein [Actinomadura kijaniata]